MPNNDLMNLLVPLIAGGQATAMGSTNGGLPPDWEYPSWGQEARAGIPTYDDFERIRREQYIRRGIDPNEMFRNTTTPGPQMTPTPVPTMTALDAARAEQERLRKELGL